jgi:membrane fusion protein
LSFLEKQPGCEKRLRSATKQAGGFMSGSLFRREALEAHSERAYGGPLLAQPLSLKLVTAASVAIATLLVIFAALGGYTRKAHVTGYLAPSAGLIKIYAPEAGTLVEKRVVEGQRVAKGEALFVVSMDRGTRHTAEAQAAAMEKLREKRRSLESERAKQSLLGNIEAQALRERIGKLQAEIAQLNREIVIQRRRLDNSGKMAARYRELARAKFVSEVQAQQKDDELLDQQAKLQALLRARVSLERDVGAARSELSAADLRTDKENAAIERSIASVEQELMEYESRRTVVISAPSDGMVSAILGEPGQVVQPSAPLASLLPRDAKLEAQLLVPSRAIGFIALNQTVALRYQAFPYQRFGSHRGRVKEIAKTLISPAEANLPVALREPVYRVIVALEVQSVQAYAQIIPLQAGMLLDADIWLDRRRLYEWAFDPIYSTTARL